MAAAVSTVRRKFLRCTSASVHVRTRATTKRQHKGGCEDSNLDDGDVTRRDAVDFGRSLFKLRLCIATVKLSLGDAVEVDSTGDDKRGLAGTVLGQLGWTGLAVAHLHPSVTGARGGASAWCGTTSTHLRVI